jgi:hypothetical protein
MLGKNVTMGKISKTKLTELPTRLLGRVLVALMIFYSSLKACIFRKFFKLLKWLSK